MDFPFFDCAYQGFASGDLLRDSWAARIFVEQGFELCIAQSFAKILGMYEERVGAFLNKSRVSLPSSSGLNLGSSGVRRPGIASFILNSPELFARWKNELRVKSGRLSGMRREIQKELEARGTPGSWGSLTT